MRLVTCGFEDGVPLDGVIPSSHGTAFVPLDATNPRSGIYALSVSSESGVPDGTSTSVLNGASMNRLWAFDNLPFLMSQNPPGMTGSDDYISRVGFTVRAYVRWNTGNLPDASKAVEFIRCTSMTDLSQYGRKALCVDHLGRLHWKADTRPLMPPTVDVTSGGHDHVASAIVPNGFLISDALALDTWHRVEIAVTPNMEAVRLNGQWIFTRCTAGSDQLRTAIAFGWNVVYSNKIVVTNTGTMGANKKVFFDDIAINDVNKDGTNQYGWPGAGRVMSTRPDDDIGASYAWVPGGPECYFGGIENGSLPNFTGSGGTNQEPHPIELPPQPAFWPAMRNIPMGPDPGTPQTWTTATGLSRGFGLNLLQSNPYDYAINCLWNYNDPDATAHLTTPPYRPPQRNRDINDNDPTGYMITCGGSDWRGAAGSAGPFTHPDTQWIYPRTDGYASIGFYLDTVVVEPALCAQTWYYAGPTNSNRTADLPLPPEAAGKTPGLKVWMPDLESDPGDIPLAAPNNIFRGKTIFSPILPLTMRLLMELNTPLGTDTSTSLYVGATSRSIYGCGIIYEDSRDSSEDLELPKICNQLLMIV